MKLQMTDDELNSVESLSDAEIAAKVRDSVKRYRATRDAAGSGLGARELEEEDNPPNQDDPPPTSGTPEPPVRNGAELEHEFTTADRRRVAADRRLAADDARTELSIRQRAGCNMDGELHLARVSRSDPSKVAAMNAAIPGLDRLK